MLARYRSNLEIFISPDKEGEGKRDMMMADDDGLNKRMGPPDPPAGRPVAEASGGLCAVLTWSSPPYDGGRCVDGYIVESRTETETEWTVVAERCHSLSVMVRGLAPGRRHMFRVRSENVHGLSEPSATSLPFCTPALTECGDEPAPPPFAPRMVSVETMEGPEGFAARYELLEELGKGRYGIVHRVTERATGHVLAAKLIRTIKAKDRQQVHDEIAVMNLLRHPKLLQLASAFEGPREMVMVMEYISGGELFERVVADDFTLTERDCILFMRQICEGVDYMHQNLVVHLDLKPENIMCQTRTSHQIKLIDFGLAQKLKPDTPVRVLFGTPEFIPPEIINYEPIGTETDMWSVGVICYVLLSGLSPFMGDNDAETFANITRADFDFDDEAFDAISQDARDFISSLLVKRKEKRLTARQCLEHSWLAQQPASMSCIALSTDKLKKFIIRRKWQKTGNAIRALGRMATLSAASRRNSAPSAAGTPRQSIASLPMSSGGSTGSPSLPRAALSLTGSIDESAGTPAEDIARLAVTAEEGEANEVVDAVGHDVGVGKVDAEQDEHVDDDEGVTTSTMTLRGRCRSERSDSGISDCSSASSRHRGEQQVLPAPAALFGKKFSISEETEEAPSGVATPVGSSPSSPAIRPNNLPLPLPVLKPSLDNPSADIPEPSVSNALPTPSAPAAAAPTAAHDGNTSKVSRRSAELLQKLGSNSSIHSPPAPAVSISSAATDAAAVPDGPKTNAVSAGHSPHKTVSLSSSSSSSSSSRVGGTASRRANGLPSPTKTRAPTGFVVSKIKCLESQSSTDSLTKVSVNVEPPKERMSLRDTWRSPSKTSVTSARSPSRTSLTSARSPSRTSLTSARSPSRTSLTSARSPSRREELPVSPSMRDAALSPSRRQMAVSPSGSPSIRVSALSPCRRAAGLPSSRSPSSPAGGSPVSPDSGHRGSRLHPSSTPSTPASPRKALLDTGLGLNRRTTPPSVYDSAPKSPTLRRMLNPNNLGTHSAGFQKTLEFWKR